MNGPRHKSDRELLESIDRKLTYLLGDVPAARAVLFDAETRAELEAREAEGNAQIERGLARRRAAGLINGSKV